MNNNTTPKKSKNISNFFEEGEYGDAQLFASKFRNKYCFDHSEKQWYMWNGQYWQEDKTGKVFVVIADIVAAEYLKEAKQLQNIGKSSEADAYIKRAKSLRYRQKINRIADLATHLPGIGLTGSEWSIPPMELPVANGIIDLTNGSLRKGKPEDYIRAYAPTEWQGLNCPAPSWENFLDAVFGGDKELISFLQRLFGYGISGEVKEQIMPIFWGEGSNGKSTMIDIISTVLGRDFSFTTQADSIMDTTKSNGEAARPFIVALRHKRLVWVSESKDGQSINAGLIKQLTGDVEITARDLYRKPITFTASHKLFLITNQLPDIPDSGDLAMTRRLLLVPFQMQFVDTPSKPNERPIDKSLSPRLKSEASGILAWLVRGSLEWQQQGLNTPKCVKIATRKFIEDSDVIGLYIEENLHIGPQYEVLASALYFDYSDWCKINGIDPKTSISFGRQMTRHFGAAKSKWVKGKSQKVYEGIGLKMKNVP